MAAEEVTAAMDKDINDHNEDGGHQDWPYKEIVAIAGKSPLIFCCNLHLYLASYNPTSHSGTFICSDKFTITVCLWKVGYWASGEESGVLALSSCVPS